MKKMTMLAVFLMVASTAFAQQFTGKVVRVIPEEEGVKIILESAKGDFSLFSTRASNNHEVIKKNAEDALTTGKAVNIQAQKKGALTEVISVKAQQQ